ncbi:MAG: DUF4907 domain-containing protein [Bacteroidota bacterium]
MKQFNWIILFSFLLLLCSKQAEAQVGIMYRTEKTNQYTSAIFQNKDRTFGYTILENGKKYIHQPSIPGRTGSRGFKTKQDAQKVATFVMDKMNKGVIPPSVTEQDLKTLNIGK